MHPLTKLQADLEEHIAEEAGKWRTLLSQDADHTKQIQELTRTVGELVKAVNELTAATEGVVESWRTLQALRRFFVWLSGFAVVGAIVGVCRKYGLI
jgi:hypothetical protein